MQWLCVFFLNLPNIPQGAFGTFINEEKAYIFTFG